MIYYVLPLEHKQATIEIVGGKGMSLSKLLTAGISVPDGFHVTTASYQIFVETNHIQSRINKLLDGIDSNNTSQLEDISKKIGCFSIMEKCHRKCRTQLKQLMLD